MTTLRAHFDGEHIQLDEPCQLKADTQLLVTVLPATITDAEREAWLRLSLQGLTRAYADDEPTYSLALIKEPNPDYAGR